MVAGPYSFRNLPAPAAYAFTVNSMGSLTDLKAFARRKLSNRTKIVGSCLQPGIRGNILDSDHHRGLIPSVGASGGRSKTESSSTDFPSSLPSRMSAVRSTQPKGIL